MFSPYFEQYRNDLRLTSKTRSLHVNFYCEGAILSLTHSLHLLVQCVTAGKAVRAPYNFSGFPRAKHNFLDRLRPNIPLLEILIMGYFKSRVEHLCDVNKKNNGGWSLHPL